jgi:flagellar hook assembly protein FlgD
VKSEETILNSEPSTFNVTLKIYNILGQEVKILVNETQEPGAYAVPWDGRNDEEEEVASGIYLYYLSAGPFSASRKMILSR